MRRSALSILVAAALVAPGCKSEGERRLIGSWEVRWDDEAGDPDATSGQPEPEGSPGLLRRLGKALERIAERADPQLTVTFNDDGTYSEAVGFGARRDVKIGRWVLASPGDDEITVRLEPAEGQGRSKAQEVTIRFRGDDEMLYPDATGQPLRFVRKGVEQAKAPPVP